MNLALFDLDHTLLPLDSDHEWGEFLCQAGAVDAVNFRSANDAWYQAYIAGTLDPLKYLHHVFSTLATIPRSRLDQMHRQFMQDVVAPSITPAVHALLDKHREAGDLVAIVTATNRYVTAPIAAALKVDHLIAAEPQYSAAGEFTGELVGTPTFGSGKITHTLAWLAAQDKTLDSFERSYFYSDSHNDLPLMSMVTDPVATNPDATLTAHAKAHDWPIIHLFDPA